MSREEIVSTIKQWMSADDEIKRLQQEIKQYKEII